VSEVPGTSCCPGSSSGNGEGDATAPGVVYRGRGPTPSSDFDLFVTLKNDVVSSAAARRAVEAQLTEIGDLFSRAKGIKVNIVSEVEAIAPWGEKHPEKDTFY
jgi:hypothetical protein